MVFPLFRKLKIPASVTQALLQKIEFKMTTNNLFFLIKMHLFGTYGRLGISVDIFWIFTLAGIGSDTI